MSAYAPTIYKGTGTKPAYLLEGLIDLDNVLLEVKAPLVPLTSFDVFDNGNYRLQMQDIYVKLRYEVGGALGLELGADAKLHIKGGDGEFADSNTPEMTLAVMFQLGDITQIADAASLSNIGFSASMSIKDPDGWQNAFGIEGLKLMKLNITIGKLRQNFQQAAAPEPMTVKQAYKFVMEVDRDDLDQMLDSEITDKYQKWMYENTHRSSPPRASPIARR
jgi:hypothetical protein